MDDDAQLAQPVVGAAASGSEEQLTDGQSWAAEYQKDYENFVHGRLERVHASAQQWLATITGVLGLFTAAIVVGGTNSVSDLSPLARHWFFGVAVGVYVLTFGAIVLGAVASFGGLGLPEVDERVLRAYIALEQKRDEIAQRRGDGTVVHRSRIALAEELLAGLRHPARPWWQQPLRPFIGWGLFTATPVLGTDLDYRIRYDVQTDKRRGQLHASRTIGILGIVLAGTLALFLLGSQAFAN